MVVTTGSFASIIWAGCKFESKDLPKFLTPSKPNNLYIWISIELNKSKSAISKETDFSNSGFNKSAQDLGTSLPFNPFFINNKDSWYNTQHWIISMWIF